MNMTYAGTGVNYDAMDPFKRMLTQINHISGQRSPVFSKLIDMAQKRGIGMMDEVKEKFIEIHNERTQGLHRLKTNLSKEEISQVSFWLFNYFQFFDEFQESQKVKSERLHGKMCRRIRYTVGCMEKHVEVKLLHLQIGQILRDIKISEEFRDWAVRHVHEIRKNEAESDSIALKTKHKEAEEVTQQLQSLTLNFTSPTNKDRTLTRMPRLEPHHFR